MAKQILLLDRVEFIKINVEINSGDFSWDEVFPQLSVDPESFDVLSRSDLFYPPDQVADPRVFMLAYGVKTSAGEALDKLPYNVEVEAVGYFRYVGGEEFVGEDRFRAVRMSGLQILYGAIREMVSNLTARSRHGLWHLPARNFGRIAETRAKEDEQKRQDAISKLPLISDAVVPKKARSRKKKSADGAEE